MRQNFVTEELYRSSNATKKCYRRLAYVGRIFREHAEHRRLTIVPLVIVTSCSTDHAILLICGFWSGSVVTCRKHCSKSF